MEKQNWAMNEPGLSQSIIGEYMGTVKTDYLMVKVNFAIHMEENILVPGKMGKKMVKGYIHILMEE